MARPLKVGLDYFPLDVNIDDDVELLEAECGLDGFAILIKLWQKIYANGYFIEWNDDIELLFSRKINADKNRVNSVINACLRRNLFDNEIYERHGILTSRGIQKRYITACVSSKRKNIVMEKRYLLVNSQFTPLITELIPEETEFTQEESTQSKVKESKVKESKEDKANSNEFSISSEELNSIIVAWNSLNLQNLTQIRDKRLLLLKARLKEHSRNSIYICIDKIKASTFLNGQNPKSWIITFDWLIKPANYIKVLEGNYDNKKPKNTKNSLKLQGSYTDVTEESMEEMLLNKRDRSRSEDSI
ncbi:protein of unknown function [Acetoanaerobium sticklandii]|uniref:Lin1244/Lin1753-like N-terminal domain-containing protein n=1 Tax=Acetoanaerobium sticklandii (strain ATCC 12662 / DSM 519 / JCM 1433 / CCUG 9281 / NCIMB 10654 / HF) TaxID=499177 RepID=E3PS15_ACESD|nr:DUF4373 domain-containing protein [Acetoanaerobium sticklandii]CBH21669.1 protein of unknown function [Acetoanaerobium sticklandii]